MAKVSLECPLYRVYYSRVSLPSGGRADVRPLLGDSRESVSLYSKVRHDTDNYSSVALSSGGRYVDF